MDRRTALSGADFGGATAERDKLLTEVFVETDLWSRMYAGDVDVVLGPKGAGKSAIYSQILNSAAALRRRKVILVGAENPADDPIFTSMGQTKDLQSREFVGLWKLYFLVTVVAKLRDVRVHDRTLSAVEARLQDEGLLPEPGQSSMVELFLRALRYADVQFGMKSEVKTPPLPVGASFRVDGTITLHEPLADRPRTDTITVNRLLQQVGTVLEKKKLSVWVLVDRLDTAFGAVGEDVEAVALRALVQTYIDLVSQQYHLSLKLFLRDDVWPRITAVQGDRMPGANVMEPKRLEWGDDRLLDLFYRRIVHNPDLCRYFDVPRRGSARDGAAQHDLVARLLPADEQWSFEALLGHLRDGAGNVAPRELIRFMSEARSIQMSRFEMQNVQYEGDELFEARTLESALFQVSNSRLYQVMCAEYPYLYEPVTRLVGTDVRHSPTDLARMWRMDKPATKRIADQLVSLGFFVPPPVTDDIYRIAPLYRPALSIR